MTFRLFVDSSTGLDVYPEYDFKDTAEKIEEQYRTRDASLYTHRWAEFQKVKFSVSFVNSEFKSIVNSWWSSNTPLLWMEVGAADVSSVQLTGKDKPVSKLQKPYTDLFAGTIEFESR